MATNITLALFIAVQTARAFMCGNQYFAVSTATIIIVIVFVGILISRKKHRR